ncbi:hypothetical protein HHI36_002048 [Cryptolaemus montrouzieri]|uniref:KRI1-like protein n=1 Tax=Cryptolaemus montrouzieri TaxID=559131 RepID=A0ABD2P9E5_9CUCU
MEKKEEFNKLKTKYGETEIQLDNDDDSSSSEDDEVGVELTEEVEKEFYKTLALLKRKDPKIYDDNAVFFDKSEVVGKPKRKADESDSMYLKDYERKLLLEKGGIASESDDDEIKEKKRDPTYVEEQKKIKESLQKVAQEEDSDNDEWGGMFQIRQANREQNEKKEADYRAWLAGQKKKLEDKETAKSLKSLKDYWGDPNLEDGEKFLRDYILNKRYLENENDDYVPTYDEVVHDSDENFSEDENAIEKQEEFEHKYNFRFKNQTKNL